MVLAEWPERGDAMVGINCWPPRVGIISTLISESILLGRPISSWRYSSSGDCNATTEKKSINFSFLLQKKNILIYSSNDNV